MVREASKSKLHFVYSINLCMENRLYHIVHAGGSKNGADGFSANSWGRERHIGTIYHSVN